MFTGFNKTELQREKELLSQDIDIFRGRFECTQITKFDFFVDPNGYIKSEFDILNPLTEIDITQQQLMKLMLCLAPNATINLVKKDTFTYQVDYLNEKHQVNHSLGVSFWRDLVNIFNTWLKIKLSEKVLAN